MNITEEMIAKEARNVLKTLEGAGHQAWCVGGCVRDTLLGRKPRDWDVTTSALPEQVMELFGRRAIPRGLKHGTVWVRSGSDGVDVTTFRCDGEYEDHRRPASVNFTDSLEEDLWRRDLTVNAIAFNLAGELRDPFGGQEDMERRILRCVGEPDRRFQEDALRMMRLLRFSAVLGFDIEPEAAAAVHRNRELLREIAIERIELEMLGLLAGQDAAEIFRQFPDVAGVFWPELLEMAGFEQHNVHHCYDVWEHTLHALDAAERLEIPRPKRKTEPPPPRRRGTGAGAAKAKSPETWDENRERTVLCCAALLHDIGKPRCFTLDENGGGHFLGHWNVGRDMAEDMLRRLRTARTFRERVVRLVEQHERAIPRTEKEMLRLLGVFGEADLRLLLILKRADNLAQSPAYRERQKELDQAEAMLDRVIRLERCVSVNQLAIHGQDLPCMGFRGPEIGLVLEALLGRVQDGELPNERRPLCRTAARMAREKRRLEAQAGKQAGTAGQAAPSGAAGGEDAAAGPDMAWLSAGSAAGASGTAGNAAAAGPGAKKKKRRKKKRKAKGKAAASLPESAAGESAGDWQGDAGKQALSGSPESVIEG